MKRIDASVLYNLAVALHPFTKESSIPPTNVQSKHTARSHARASAERAQLAREAIKLLEESLNVLPMHVSRRCAERVRQGLQREIDSRGDISYSERKSLRDMVRAFESTFLNELETLDTYAVKRRDSLLPEHIGTRLPQRVGDDFKCAEQCLATGNQTAAAFHALRAVEGSLDAYCNSAGISPRKSGWKECLDRLKRHPEISANVLAFLDHIRGERNAIAHPERFLSDHDAESLLLFAASALSIIVSEMEKLEADTKPMKKSVADTKPGPPVENDKFRKALYTIGADGSRHSDQEYIEGIALLVGCSAEEAQRWFYTECVSGSPEDVARQLREEKRPN